MPDFRNDPTLPSPAFPGSHMVLDDQYVFLSGLTAGDIQGGETVIGDIAEETRSVMRKVEYMLHKADCELADIVRADVHLTDLNEISTMDAVYAEFFTEGQYPARTCTESAKLFGESHVEITVMARRNQS
ncbi:RidA family protein [Aidingimonas halophila]|uniref:2-iminobutanoate/2-iminopropanoate deaminase n=1 Tax=Aidingimonas halophila TaxID=574349 RepID=A0A1H2SL06_9GAMM|nr:RidA family protein [Aidingimonas halophila]GHC17502.1 putative aminoacrylate peracid reductase RutC [Aidingimonas halophila]SDW32218.1 2-iminobutanoate/2-iminopropanoate deaminase [Aidingimonas halophila]